MPDTTEEDELSSESREASDEGDPDAEPGATIMWFGEYQDIRLDKLPEWYRRYLVYWSKEDPTPNGIKFRALHVEYLAWLDQRRSPLSTLIWFGKFKGHEIRLHYHARRRWRYLVNYRGGKWRNGEETLSELESPDGESNDDETDQDGSERTGSDHEYSDSSMPSLAHVRRVTTPIDSPPTKSRLRKNSKVIHLGQRRCARDHSNSDSDTDAPTVPGPVSRFDRRKRKRLTIISSSDDEDSDDDIISSTAKSRKNSIELLPEGSEGFAGPPSLSDSSDVVVPRRKRKQRRIID